MISAWRWLGRGAGAFALASVTLASPSSNSAASAAPPAGSASHGGMQVTGAFVPLPASPSVASAYLVFHNLTGRADTLLLLGTDPNPAEGPAVITYDGWPLYTFVKDHKPRQAKGQALDDAGGFWYVIAPSGQPITVGA